MDAKASPGLVLVTAADGHSYWGTPAQARAELVEQGWRNTDAAELVEIGIDLAARHEATA